MKLKYLEAHLSLAELPKHHRFKIIKPGGRNGNTHFKIHRGVGITIAKEVLETIHISNEELARLTPEKLQELLKNAINELDRRTS